jgi:hypothetical protein
MQLSIRTGRQADRKKGSRNTRIWYKRRRQGGIEIKKKGDQRGHKYWAEMGCTVRKKNHKTHKNQ